MYINIQGTTTEIIDPNRQELGPVDLLFVDHSDFDNRPIEFHQLLPNGHVERVANNRVLQELRQTAPEGRGSMVARWNHGFRSGIARSPLAFGPLDDTIGRVDIFKTPNCVIVPRQDGYTELHAMMASLLPDDLLPFSPRPIANFCLWPFTAGSNPAIRRPLAESITQRFKTLVWNRLLRKRHGRNGEKGLSKDSSLKIVLDDSNLWMSLLYQVAMRRADKLTRPEDEYDHLFEATKQMASEVARESGGKPPVITGNYATFFSGPGGMPIHAELPRSKPEPMILAMTDRNGDIVGHRMGLRAFKTLPACLLWDPREPESRESVIEEMIRHAPEWVHELADQIRDGAMPEDVVQRKGSRMAEDVNRAWYGRKRNSGDRFLKQVSGEVVDNHAVIHPDFRLVDNQDLLRGTLVLFDERAGAFVQLFTWGRTTRQIASDLGLNDHSAVSRLLKRMQINALRAQPHN